jgi:hypothetical protein
MKTYIPKQESPIDKMPKLANLLEGEGFLSMLMVIISVSATLVILFA